MKTKKYKKSNITLLIIIGLIIGFNIFEVSQITTNDNEDIGMTTHKLGYISCLSVEDNVKTIIIVGDTNSVKVSPNIEMFYSSGCLSIRGNGTASLTLQKNTLTALALEKLAIVKGEIGDSLQYMQCSGNSQADLQGGNINNLEIQIKDNAKIKLNVTKIVNLTGEIRDIGIIKIYGKVENPNIQEAKGSYGRLEIYDK